MTLFVFVAVLTAVVMEPISAMIHRRIGHGMGWVLHRSHHDGPVAGPELNDVIPAVMALFAIAAFATGVMVSGFSILLPVATGVTTYGLVYAVVHDLYIHRRLPLLPKHIAILEPLKAAHLKHHRTGTGHWGILSRLHEPASTTEPGSND